MPGSGSLHQNSSLQKVDCTARWLSFGSLQELQMPYDHTVGSLIANDSPTEGDTAAQAQFLATGQFVALASGRACAF